MRIVALTLVLLTAAIPAQETEKGKTYLCVPDKATGFAFREGNTSWEQTNFNVDEKYLIRPLTKNDSSSDIYEYGFWEIGLDFPWVRCVEGISSRGRLYCNSTGGFFEFSSISNRFMYVSSGGYVGSIIDHQWDENDKWSAARKADEGGDSPYIVIGKCTEL